jgi:hypothetical protein
MNPAKWIDANCDGSGPHNGNETRLRPIGGNANLILCLSCWARENRYCFERGRETGAPENWPQQDYHKAQIYATEQSGVAA